MAVLSGTNGRNVRGLHWALSDKTVRVWYVGCRACLDVIHFPDSVKQLAVLDAGRSSSLPYGKCWIKKARYAKRWPTRIPYVDPLPKVAWTVERTSRSLWFDPT